MVMDNTQHIWPHRFLLQSSRFIKCGLLAGKEVSMRHAGSVAYLSTVTAISSEASVRTTSNDVEPRRRPPNCPENLASYIIL